MTNIDTIALEGRTLPDFELPTSAGGTLSSRDLHGSWTVIYTYPKDNTPGCTIEAKEFSALKSEFDAIGVRVYGLSADSLSDHASFISSCDLSIDLVSDPDHVLIDALGAWGERSMYGRTFEGTLRQTYLIGPDLTVARVWKDVKPQGHPKAVLDDVAGRVSA